MALMVFGLSAGVDALEDDFVVIFFTVFFFVAAFDAMDFLVVTFFAATFLVAAFFLVVFLATEFLADGFFAGNSAAFASAVAMVVFLSALVVLNFLTPFDAVDLALAWAGATNSAGFVSSAILLVGRISQYPSNFAPCTTINDVAFKLPSSEPVEATSTLPRASTLPLTLPLTVKLLD